MRLPKRITLKWLERRDACQTHCQLFAEVFPDGMDLNRANLRLAARKGLNVDWLSFDLLSPSRHLDYEERVNKKYSELAFGSHEDRRKFYMYAAPILADFAGLE